MTVVGGGLYHLRVETAPAVFTEVGDLTRVTFDQRGGTARTRVFRKTYVRSQRKEYTLTAVGLLNEDDVGQAALLNAEATNTPITVQFSQDGGVTYQQLDASVTTTTNEAPADDFEQITYDLIADVAPVPVP